MQITFDTNSAADVAFIRTLLGIPAPATHTQQPAGPTLPIPAGVPADAVWTYTPGGLALLGKDGRDYTPQQP